MKRTIHPDKSAYLVMGAIAAVVVMAMMLGMGSREEKLLPAVATILVAGAFAVWCWILQGHCLKIDENGITRQDRFRKTRRLAWPELERSEIPYLSGRPPMQILVWGRHADSPSLTVPLKLYGRDDVRFLLELDELRWTDGDPDGHRSFSSVQSAARWKKSA
jgi:hypothetical protein